MQDDELTSASHSGCIFLFHSFIPRGHSPTFSSSEPLSTLCFFSRLPAMFVSKSVPSVKSPVPELRAHQVTCGVVRFDTVPSKSLCRQSRVWTNSRFHISDKLQGKYRSTLTTGRGWGVEKGENQTLVRQQSLNTKDSPQTECNGMVRDTRINWKCKKSRGWTVQTYKQELCDGLTPIMWLQDHEHLPRESGQ